ncbi:Major facilitator superfamily transporter [Entamoeba marina]
MTSTLKVLIKVKDLLLSNFYRLCLTAFLFNFSAYFFWIVVPLLADDIGATSLELSIIQAVSYGLGAFFSPFAGKLTDLVNPYLLFRIADLWCLYFDVCFYSVGSGLFWPVVGSTVGKEAPIGKENRNSSIYSVCWSFGKSVGYLFGGMLKKALGNNALFVAVACAGSCLIIYPIRLPKEVIEREKQKKKQQEEHKDQKIFPVDVKVTPVDGDEDLEIPIDVVDDLEAQTGVDIEELKSDHVEGHDLEEVIVADPKELGLKVYLPLADPPEMYMAFYYVFTTIWTYKRSLILAGQAMIMFLFVMVAVSDSEVVLLILSFISGFVAGFAYQTSTYYRMAKLGMAFLPLFAGLLTNIFNNNYYISIYIGIIVVLLCTLLCQITYHVGYTINRWRQNHDHTQTTVSEKQTTSQTENTNIAIDPSADEDDGGNDVNEVEIEVEENEQQQ